MPYNYTIYKRILHEINMRVPGFKPETALDYGAGLGSGVWAIHTIYGDDGNRVTKRVAAVEPNMPMRKLGKFLSQEQFDSEVLWVDSLAMVPTGERGKFDLIVLGFVLQEVPSPKARQLVIEALW
jgi:ribosomal protein RSM22 (predicted rRNA methylase)